jgi:iron complex outermembrane receptor protein
MLRFIFTTFLFITSFQTILGAESIQVDGRVIDQQSQEAIVGAEILWENSGTISDLHGKFSLRVSRGDSVLVRMIGYRSLSLPVRKEVLDVYLQPTILEGQSIDVTASRVIPGITPVAYSTLRQKEIELHYSTQDVPMVLSSEPGIHAYSESGNGTGYSYVSIRGFDQSRIAVMLNNVPLNDNESHQVYWVDHGDILSDASDVEIQRGVGNSLYGSSAFGGSINVNTSIRSQEQKLTLSGVLGSYDTRKIHLSYRSGTQLGDHLSLSLRLSGVDSDGYRQDSSSKQRSLSAGLEYGKGAWTHQLRMLLGEAVSVLQWDGVSQDMLQDDEQRRLKLPWTVPFTDNFLQQIYSLNSSFQLSERSIIRNVAYVVTGSGYYEVDKYGVDYYQYNLDIHDHYSDDAETLLATDLSRKKWIQNQYYGIVPVWTYEGKRWRSDMGLELRQYRGDHFGEVNAIGDSLLSSQLPQDYRYYGYQGRKQLQTIFAHFLMRLSPNLSAIVDIQGQQIDWQLNQEAIGHAPGVDLNAAWRFLNPKLGMNYQLLPSMTLFAGVGRAQKEPADAQIIEADDVWSTPVDAPVEDVINYELGLNWFSGPAFLNLNLYHIRFQNEVLQDIYDFEEGQFTVESSEHTVHQGLEIDMGSQYGRKLQLGLNASLARFTFETGENQQNHLPNVPGVLANLYLKYELNPATEVGLTSKFVGEQYIDKENTEVLAIPSYQLVNLLLQVRVAGIHITGRINNLLNMRYATYGYAWGDGYYWPGATRNYSLSLNYSFQ